MALPPVLFHINPPYPLSASGSASECVTSPSFLGHLLSGANIQKGAGQPGTMPTAPPQQGTVTQVAWSCSGSLGAWEPEEVCLVESPGGNSDANNPSQGRFHRWRAWFSSRWPLLQPLAATQMLPSHPHFCPTGYKFGSSHYPFRFSNCLE